jgi:hypothetical protein
MEEEGRSGPDLEVGIEEGWSEVRRVLESRRVSREGWCGCVMVMMRRRRRSAIAIRDGEDVERLVERGEWRWCE